jgi:group I intron endonuclease
MVVTVYRVTCLVNDKLYFGVTRQTLQRRQSRHLAAALGTSPYPFHRAIRKHGPNNFLWNVIAELPSVAEAYALEVALIKEHRTIEHTYGYNSTQGGEGSRGYRHSEDTRTRLSKIVADWFAADPKRREHMRQSRLGKKLSDSTRRKLSESHRGLVKSPATCEKIRTAKRAKFTDTFRMAVVKDARNTSLRAAARKHSVDRRTLGRWLRETAPL